MRLNPIRSTSALLAVAAVAALVSHWLSDESEGRVFEDDLIRTLAMLKTSHPKPGIYSDLRLPAARGASIGREATLIVTPGGRAILLVKTSIGWKANYRGVVYSDAPLRPADFGTDGFGRRAVMVPGLGTPALSRVRSRQWVEVYDDVG